MPYVPYQLLTVHNENVLRDAAARRLTHQVSKSSRRFAPALARPSLKLHLFRLGRPISHA